MYFLIYRSESNTVLDEKALMLLLTQSRERNKKLDITGMLVYFDNKFLQLLEGNEEDVEAVYQSIHKDKRHKDVTVLKKGSAEKRLFPGWTMSFRAASLEEMNAEPGYKDIYKPGSAGAKDLVCLFNRLRGKSVSGVSLSE